MKKLNLLAIRVDGGTQSRAALNETTVYEYAEALIDGANLPAVVVFHDGTDYWLADGFHRFHAHRKAELASIAADVYVGTLTDAKLYSFGANKHHGLRRSNEDKRNAVAGMLELFADWSDNRIAKHVGVSVSFVGAIRRPEVAERQRENRNASASKAAGCSPTTTPALESTTGEPAEKPTPQAEAEQLTDDPLDDFDPLAELEEAQKTIERMTAELTVAESDDAKAEALKWRRAYDIATRRQSELMDSVATSQRREKWTMDQLRRCGKAVGEEDPARIAKAVERAVKVAA